MIIKLSLPNNIVLKVKKGEKINFDDCLYEYSHSLKITIDIAKKLEIKPIHIFQYLVKMIGQPIKKGELLAKKKGFFSTKKIISDYNGIIREINHQTGEIIITGDETTREPVYSNFKGTIINLDKNYLKVEIEDGKSFALKEINHDGGGESFFFQNEGLFFQISEDQVKNKVIILEDLKPHLETKCEALGVKGFVFLKGEPSTNLPFARIKNLNDYSQICQLKKKYIIFSQTDKIGIVYN